MNWLGWLFKFLAKLERLCICVYGVYVVYMFASEMRDLACSSKEKRPLLLPATRHSQATENLAKVSEGQAS